MLKCVKGGGLLFSTQEYVRRSTTMLVGVGGNLGCTVFRVFSSGWGGGTQKLKLRGEVAVGKGESWEGSRCGEGMVGKGEVMEGKSRWGRGKSW